MIYRRKKIRVLEAGLDNATTWDEWSETAKKLDHLKSNDVWKADCTSPGYDQKPIMSQIKQLREYRQKGEIETLAYFMSRSLHRYLGDILDSRLYIKSRTGTKDLTETYFSEIEASLEYICETKKHDFPLMEKIRFLEQASLNFGRSALMLSGGATLGLFHLGVVKALLSRSILPGIISGSSTGSIVAAIVCTRTDKELVDVFSKPYRGHARVWRRFGLFDIIKNKAVMNPDQLLENIRANIGDFTFEEAFDRTGKILNIAVSPARARQKPRALNYLTAPQVLISSAVQASCSVPGLFPPATLLAKNRLGSTVRYMPREKWVDGTIYNDLPMMELSRLHNVSHYIVSQTNPHVLPFVRARTRHGSLAFAADMVSSMILSQFTGITDAIRTRVHSDTFRPMLDLIHAVAHQKYTGDITISPDFKTTAYFKLVSNPSYKDIRQFILKGERATWPKIALIGNHIRTSRAFEQALQKMKQRMHMSGYDFTRLTSRFNLLSHFAGS
ncbi:DUF3336 domain-containing protein [Desulfobacterales bacterium HSG16]|nr:DUF3336 domain-containing protein [Desulfobacterales bacterium HSG16]